MCVFVVHVSERRMRLCRAHVSGSEEPESAERESCVCLAGPDPDTQLKCGGAADGGHWFGGLWRLRDAGWERKSEGEAGAVAVAARIHSLRLSHLLFRFRLHTISSSITGCPT